MSKSELRCKKCGEIKGHKKNCKMIVYELCSYCQEIIPKYKFAAHRSSCIKRKDNIKKEKIFISKEDIKENLEE